MRNLLCLLALLTVSSSCGYDLYGGAPAIAARIEHQPSFVEGPPNYHADLIGTECGGYEATRLAMRVSVDGALVGEQEFPREFLPHRLRLRLGGRSLLDGSPMGGAIDDLMVADARSLLHVDGFEDARLWDVASGAVGCNDTGVTGDELAFASDWALAEWVDAPLVWIGGLFVEFDADFAPLVEHYRVELAALESEAGCFGCDPVFACSEAHYVFELGDGLTLRSFGRESVIATPRPVGLRRIRVELETLCD